jgi:hypothetical protein
MKTRYLSGLCVAGLGLCAGGWLLVAALAFGGEGGHARLVNLMSGAALLALSALTATAWAVTWRRRLRADGVLVWRVSHREARRNRRRLARDIRQASRLAKRATGRAAGPAAGDFGISGYVPDEPAYRDACRLTGDVPAGSDGVSAAELLGELRALLEPLLAAAGPARSRPAARRWPADWTAGPLPETPRPGTRLPGTPLPETPLPETPLPGTSLPGIRETG